MLCNSPVGRQFDLFGPGPVPVSPSPALANDGEQADERHLWPEWRRLIAECRPPVIFGEQVASPAGRDWLAALRADLEALEYTVGAADLCAASCGAPHIRQRLYFVAISNGRISRDRGLQQAGNTCNGRRTQWLASWPTPCQQDGPKEARHRGQIDFQRRRHCIMGDSCCPGLERRRAGIRYIARMQNALARKNCLAAEAHLTTSGFPATGSTAETGSSGQLNPDHSAGSWGFRTSGQAARLR